MVKIYLIINKKNNKKYVGQTTTHVAVRFCQHIDAAYRNASKKRRNDFYRDIKESGENVFQQFIYKILEECDDSEKLKREVFYIDKIKPEYNENFKSEYIKSIENIIIEEYKNGNNITEIRKKYRCRHQLISPIIKKAIQDGKVKRHNSNKNYKKVYKYDINGKIEKEWYSASDCSFDLGIDRGNIRMCCVENSKENMLYYSAGGHRFKYDNNIPKDMYEIINKKTNEIIRFKTKDALIAYFKNKFPKKNILYGQLVRDRKSVYGYIIKKLYDHRY